MNTNSTPVRHSLKRVRSLTITCLIVLFALPVSAAEEPNEKAEKYHSALLRRPSGGYLFDRFLNAWLDTGTIDGMGEFLSEHGETTADRLLHGYFLVKIGREAEALSVFEKALEGDPENAEAWAEAAKARARVLDFEKAVADLDQAIELSDDDDLSIEYGKLKGRWLARTGKTEDALGVWKSLAGEHPDDDELREDLVELQLAESLVEEALETQKALVEFTSDPYHKITRRLRLGDIHLRAGEQEEAKRIYGESLEASGTGTWLEKEILAQIEQLFRREDDIAGLEEYYSALVEKTPGRIAVRLRLADILVERGEGDKAVETFQGILKMTPGDRANREAFVDLLGRLEKLDEAVEQMTTLAESFPDDPELVAQLAAWQHQAEQKDAAAESVHRFLELSDGSEYSHLRAARMLEQFEQADAAKAMFETLVAKFPDSTGAVDEQAAFLHRTGETEKAIELWKGIAATGDSQDAVRAARMLSARGERESAYNILLERADDFATDFVFLGRLCNEALASDHAEEAIPWMEKRLALADNPGDLAEVLRQAVSILRAAKKSDEYREQLRERTEELSVSDACLLSEMLDRNGEYDAATAVLEPLMGDGEILALDQRVRQLVSRDDWQTAAAEMERIVELPDGRRSNNIERLVELHRRALDYEAALAWLDEWKKISPGASRPWLFQARTLYEKGDTDEAIEVLRQAASRFDDEEDARTLLASYYSQQGKDADAERIYWNLYEESEEIGSKLRWVSSLAQTAEAQGEVDELVEQFEERRRDNRTSIAPLLAIAEVHRRTNNYEGRREALLEATRMRPEDLGLLREIARIEESEGDWERSVETLKSALPLDTTDDTEKRIALLHLRYGDEEEAYRRFYELSGGDDMDADTVIGLADAMIARSNWDRVLRFLDEHHERLPKDYRVGYLRGIALEESAEDEAAMEAFLALLEIEEDVLKKASNNQSGIVSSSARRVDYMGELPDGTSEFFLWTESRYSSYYYRRALQSGQVRFSSNPMSGSTGVVRLPSTLEEARNYALMHINSLVQYSDDEEIPALVDELTARGVENAKLIPKLIFADDYSSNLANQQDLLEEFPDNEVIQSHLVATQAQNFRNPSSVPTDSETLLRIHKNFLERYPHLSLLSAYGLAVNGDEKASDAIEQAIAEVEKKDILPALATSSTSYLLLSHSETIPENLKKDLLIRLQEWTERATEEYAKKNPNASTLVRFAPSDPIPAVLRMSDDLTDYVTYLVEKFEGYEKAIQKLGSGASSQSGLGTYLRYMNQSRPLIGPLGFPAPETPGIAANVMMQFITLEQINFGFQLVPVESDDVLKVATNVEDPVLRSLFLSLTEDEEATGKAVEEFLAAAQEEGGRLPLREALLAAGWYQQTEQWQKASDLLESIRLAPMSGGLRERIDAGLVHCAIESDAKEKPDSSLAKRGADAALRLRYGFLSAQERGDLVVALDTFGLTEESDRLEAKGTAQRSASSSTMSSSGVQGLPQQLQALSKKGDKDRAMKLLGRTLDQNVRTMISTGGGSWDYNILRAYYELVRNNKTLLNEYHESMEPGVDATGEDYLEYAYLRHLANDLPEASKAFEKALDLLPDKARERILPAAAMIIATQDAELGATLLSQVEHRLTGQLGDLATAAFSPNRYSSTRDEELDDRINQSRALTIWLKSVTESEEMLRSNLSWIENLRYSLASSSRKTPSLFSEEISAQFERENPDLEKMKVQREAHDALCLVMMEFPQLARDAFSCYAALQVADQPEEAFTNSELLDLAFTALEKSSTQRRAQQIGPSEHWHFIYTRSHSLWYPEEFLMWSKLIDGISLYSVENLLDLLRTSGDRNAVKSATAFSNMLFGNADEFATGAEDYLNSPGGASSSNSAWRMAHATDEIKSRASKCLLAWNQRNEEFGDSFSFEEFLMEQVSKSKRSLRNESTVLAADYVVATADENGWPAAERLVYRFTEGWLGDRDTWDRFKRDDQAARYGNSPNGYGDASQLQFAGFLQRIGWAPQFAFSLAEFLSEHSLDIDGHISQSSLPGRLNNSSVSNNPSLVRSIYSAGPFVAEIDKFATGPVGSGNKLAMVQLLDHAGSWNDQAEKKAFREFLKNKDTFGARLSLAYLDRKENPRGVLNLLAENFSAIEAMPEERRGDLVSIVSAAYPKGIPNEGLDGNAAALAELLGAQREASTKEKAQELLELDALKKHGIDRDYELVQKAGEVLNPLLQLKEYDLLAEIYWHLMEIVNREQKNGGWGYYDSGWNAHGDFLYNWLDDVAQPTIERIVLFERIVRQDTEGKIAVCRVGRFPWLLNGEFDRRGGKDDLEGTLTELFSYLWKECGEGVNSETLGYSCDGFVGRLKAPEAVRAIAWADANAKSNEPWAPFADELAMNWRRVIAQKEPAGWEKHESKLSDPDAWQEHDLSLIQNESIPNSWRIAIAGPAARVPLERSSPELVFACADLLADVLQTDAPLNGWRFVDVIKRFNTLPVDDHWKETAAKIDKGWIAKNRNNAKDDSTGLAWDPWDDPVRVALHMYARLGDEDKLNRFRREDNAKNLLDGNARPVFCLVEHGFYEAALEELRRSLEFADIGTDYPAGGNDYIARYNNTIHENIPEFLATIDDVPLRFFAELILRGAIDLPNGEKEKDATYKPRNARMAELANKFLETDFQGRDDLRLSSLRQFAFFDNGVWILREPLNEAAEHFELPELIATNNTQKVRYGMRVPAAKAILGLKNGDLTPVRQHIVAVRDYSSNDRYYYSEALEAFTERIAVSVRNQGQAVPALEIQSSADALHLLLAIPKKEIIEYGELRLCATMKVVADVIAEGHPDSSSQLETTEMPEVRVRLLGQELASNPAAFWNLTAAGLKFAAPDMKVRPDDGKRRKQIERVLKHPLAQAAVEKERDLWAKMVASKWVRADEKESDWAKELLAGIEEK